MKKIIVSIVFLISVVFIFKIIKEDESVNIQNKQLSNTFLSKHIPIIDIRTKEEWKKTGIVKGSILLTFYDENGKFNEDSFLKSLNNSFNKKSQFAILCRSGNRSNRVTRYLKSKGYINIINLAGGIKQGIKNKVSLVSFYEN